MARTAAFGFVALLALGGSTAAFAQQNNEPRNEPKKEDPAPQAERRSTARQGLIDREIEESPRCEDRDLDLIQDGSHHDNPR